MHERRLRNCKADHTSDVYWSREKRDRVSRPVGRTGVRRAGKVASAVMIRVEDVNAQHDRARQHGARILRPPADYPYGERQCTIEDLGGHYWTFSQSIADVDPRDWGGTPGQL